MITVVHWPKCIILVLKLTLVLEKYLHWSTITPTWKCWCGVWIGTVFHYNSGKHIPYHTYTHTHVHAQTHAHTKCIHTCAHTDTIHTQYIHMHTVGVGLVTGTHTVEVLGKRSAHISCNSWVHGIVHQITVTEKEWNSGSGLCILLLIVIQSPSQSPWNQCSNSSTLSSYTWEQISGQ